MVINPTELKKLSDLLKADGIAHEYRKVEYAMGDHNHICIPTISDWDNRNGFSVAINCLTMGHDRGLLEFWDGRTDPIGYLTAEEALEIIRKKVM